MFDSVFSRVGNARLWRRADVELCEVPTEPDRVSDVAQRLLTVAGGLALVISRCPRGSEKRHYPASVELYEKIRLSLRSRRFSPPDAELLLDSFHEVSPKLDPVSRIAFREALMTQSQLEQCIAKRNRATPSFDDSRAPLPPSSFQIIEEN